MNAFRNWRHRRYNVPVPEPTVPEPTIETVVEDQAHAMTDMASTLSVLQDEVAIVNAPADNHFKLSGFFLAVMVAIVVAAVAFFGVSQLSHLGDRGDNNRDQIRKNCQVRNEQVATMNQKFAQLSFLFDLALKEKAPPGELPPTSEILRAVEEFRKPIALIDCTAPL